MENQGRKNRIYFRQRWPWPGGVEKLGRATREALQQMGAVNPVLVCLGSPNNPGDALGPLVGSILTGHHSLKCPVYGTMQTPIHSNNIENCMAIILRDNPQGDLVVVDAAAGSPGSIGMVTVRTGATWPGLGLGKTILPLGDIAITAVVRARAGSRWGRIVQLLRGRPERWASALAEVIAEGILLGMTN